MKKLFTFLTIMAFAVIALAQAPEKFSYQAVIRNASGQLVFNGQVGVRVSILKNSADGTSVYCETHQLTTNANGLLTMEIGAGNVVDGVFSTIDWSDGPYFVKTETDVTGGSNYTLTGTQQLLSVPYALYAKYAENGVHGGSNIDTSELADLRNRVSVMEQALLLPSVNTLSVGTIYSQSAIFTGEVISHGASHVSFCGFCWSTAPQPTLDDNHTSMTGELGTFSETISDLSANTTYYFRAYASNSYGTTYGNELNFTTLDSVADGQPCPGDAIVTDIDNNTYHTVKIGNQCWLKENLRTTRYSDGVSIPNGGGGIISYDDPYRYFPNYDSSNVAKSLASTIGWTTSTDACVVGNDLTANNATGFSAYPAGMAWDGNAYFGSIATYWSTNGSDGFAIDYNIKSDNADVRSYSDNMWGGFSVRCLRN